MVSDRSLGNVMADGTNLLPDPVSQELSTQAGHLLLWGGENLLKGQVGQFSLIEGRSHKLKRVARSSYAAEVMPSATWWMRRSKDAYDRARFGNSTQKSVNLELASIREITMRPNTQVRWTDGENMISDVLTKDIPSDHLKETLMRGTWAIEYQPEFVKAARRVARESWVKS